MKDAKVDGLTRTQILGIKLRQAIVESPEPGKFGVQRETAIIADFAIILMKAESGSLQRVSSEIRLNIFLGYGFVFGILSLRSAGCAGEQERQQGNQQPACEPASSDRSNPGVNESKEPHRHPAS